jgi:hypothetical protein
MSSLVRCVDVGKLDASNYGIMFCTEALRAESDLRSLRRKFNTHE